jgi:hypothetical protein
MDTHNNALFFEKELCYEDDGALLFAPSPKRIIAKGKSVNGEPYQVQTPPADEAEFLDAALDALRLGLVEPVYTLTPTEWAAVERESIGQACQWDGTRAIE